MVRPLPMPAQLLAEGLPEGVLLSSSRPRKECGQRQAIVEMVCGDKHHTDGAAQRLRSQPGGCECLVVVANEAAADLSQNVKEEAGSARGPVRFAEARGLGARRLVGRSLQTRNEVLLEPERVEITVTLGDDIRVL